MPDTNEGEKSMALFVIYGVQNCGKTHTAWLVYNLLKNAGREIDFVPRSLTSRPTFSEVLEQIRTSHATSTMMLYSDFRALFEHNGKRIAIFSAGDALGDDIDENNPFNEDDFITFKNNMHWAELNEVDHVICCSRYNRTPGGVRKYILDNYRMHIYRWYCKNWKARVDEKVEDAQRIAIEVFTDIQRDC